MLKYEILFEMQNKKVKKYRKCSSNVLKTKNGRAVLLTKCAVCNSKKSRLTKEQEAK